VNPSRNRPGTYESESSGPNKKFETNNNNETTINEPIPEKKTEPQEEVQPKKKLPPGAKGMFGGGLMSELNAKLKKRNTES